MMPQDPYSYAAPSTTMNAFTPSNEPGQYATFDKPVSSMQNGVDHYAEPTYDNTPNAFNYGETMVSMPLNTR
jgi:hypothetical protein